MEEQEKDLNQEESPIEGTVFKEKESKIGPMVGAVIVILIIVVGGIYFWSSQVEQIKEMNQEQQMNNEEQVDDIEAEIEAFDTVELEAEIDALIEDLDSQ